MTTTLTARNPEDLLAMVPVVFGFVPTDSIAMLTFGAEQTFHARVDLPPPGEPTEEVVESLRDPAARHGVRRVVFVLYADDALPAERVCRRLVRAFRASGIEVVDVIRADGRRWFPMLRGRRATCGSGTAYDVSGHPFAAQAVLDGQVTHRSRTELAGSLETDGARAAGVVVAGGSDHPSDDDPLWVRATTVRHAAAGTVPSDAEAARLLRAVHTEPDALAAACTGVSRAAAAGHVALWTDLVRRAPEERLPTAASVLALMAWLTGHGALAWCAVDRATALDPDHELAGVVGDLLMGAVPPTTWDEMRAMPDPA